MGVSVGIIDEYATPEERCWKQYFEYLCSWSGMRPVWDANGDGGTYRFALKALFDTEFYWTVELDANRASDGKYQRASWLDQINKERIECGEDPFDFPVLNTQPNCFEVLIGLAWRMEEDFMHDNDLGDRSRLWFWKMLENARLLEWDDVSMDGDRYEILVGRLRDILDRKFSREGFGGFFPIPRHPETDARQTQFWSLAMVWLTENYYDSGWID